MEKKPFVPPAPYIDPPSQQTIEMLSQMTVRDQKAFKKTDFFKRYAAPTLERRKLQRKQATKNWWKNNWIAILSLIFAFIAAVPVIIQGIDSILKLLG